MSAILAAFDSEVALLEALRKLRAEQVGELQTYTPKVLEGEPTGSPLPLIIFVAGVTGAVAAFALMTYADVWNYPLDIGGRPKFSWPSFVPIAFEVGVLWALTAGFFGFFAVNRMPTLYEPVDECESFRQASRDGWFIAIRSDDPKRHAIARRLLDDLRPAVVEDIPE